MRLIFFLFCFSVLCQCTHGSQALTYNKTLDGYEYPFAPKSFEFQSQKQSLKMIYMDLNQNSTKVIVLLHGKNFAGYYWEKIAKDLAQKGYRVIIPDQVGFGKSSKPEYYQYSFYQLSDNTLKLLDSLQIKKFTLVGHSMGGMLAIHLTYYQPKKVSKLILINPIGLEPYLKYVEFKDPEFFYENEISKTPKKMREYQKKNYYDGKWSEKYEQLLIPHIGQMNHSDWPLVAWNNALTYGPIFNEDITSKMNTIATPVVLVLGTRDRTGPGRGWKKEGVKYPMGQYQLLGNKTKNRFKDAKLIELKGLGHMPFFEDYKRFKNAFVKALAN